jgi:threonine dehydrogenase-like Zn-dependent dehydrogenase
MIRARALWLAAEGRAALRTEEIAYPGGDDWCVVRALFSALSPGTERVVAEGRVPASLRQEMRCPYMGGRFPFPVKYGYSLVGEVVQGPEGLRGGLVHVLHPHQDVCVVRTADVRPLPPGVPPERATLTSNLETAVTAVWDSGVALGERVLVVGFGIVGSLIARVLSLGPAVDLEIAETRPARRALAERLGFRTSGRGETEPFDVAFDASGAAAGLQAAIDRVGVEGRVVAVSWLGEGPAGLELGGAFHSRRKRIVGSQVSRIPGPMQPRWDAARRTGLVFRLLERPEFGLHVGPAVAFTELPKVYGRLIGRSPQGLSPLVIY